MMKEIKVLKIDETVAQSMVKDAFTLVTVAFMVYISKDSTFWTFITGLMFIVFMWAKLDSMINKAKSFKNTDQVRAWLDRIDEEQERNQ